MSDNNLTSIQKLLIVLGFALAGWLVLAVLYILVVGILLW